MVAIATVQVLIEDEQAAAQTLEALRAAALTVEGIKDVRVQDSQGPLLHWPDMTSRISVTMGNYKGGEAFASSHFCLPLNRTLQTRPLDVGNLTLRVPMPMQDGRSSIDLDLRVDVDSVAVELRPSDAPAGQAGNAATAALSFDRATQVMQGLRSSTRSQCDLDGLRFDLVDNATGRPIVGPVLTTVAVGAYSHASVLDGDVVLHGLHISQVLDDRFVQATSLTDDSNAPQPLYFTDEGEIVGPSRIRLQEKPKTKE